MNFKNGVSVKLRNGKSARTNISFETWREIPSGLKVNIYIPTMEVKKIYNSARGKCYNHYKKVSCFKRDLKLV